MRIVNKYVETPFKLLLALYPALLPCCINQIVVKYRISVDRSPRAATAALLHWVQGWLLLLQV